MIKMLVTIEADEFDDAAIILRARGIEDLKNDVKFEDLTISSRIFGSKEEKTKDLSIHFEKFLRNIVNLCLKI